MADDVYVPVFAASLDRDSKRCLRSDHGTSRFVATTVAAVTVTRCTCTVSRLRQTAALYRQAAAKAHQDDRRIRYEPLQPFLQRTHVFEHSKPRSDGSDTAHWSQG